MPFPMAPLLILLFLLLVDPIALCLLAKPPVIPPPWRHHVFLSFRGPDVRHTFTDHLYSALVRKGIKAFSDDRDLPRGANVKEGITRAIEDSMLSIVVLSRGYASSEWCLDELVKIMLTMKEKGHHHHYYPFPVFYQVSPDDVANHQSSGLYKDDFDFHKTRYSYERVERWSQALTSIAGISGWVLSGDRSEAEMVEDIAEEVLWKVHELGRESSSSVVASGRISPSLRRVETGKQKFICGDDDDDDNGRFIRICGRTNSRVRREYFRLERSSCLIMIITTRTENLGSDSDYLVPSSERESAGRDGKRSGLV